MIERVAGIYKGRNKSSTYKDLVFSVATSPNTDVGTKEQTRQALGVISENLKELGSSKENILSAQVFIARMNEKSQMDEAWCSWVGDNQANWPQRACLGVELEGDVLVEVTVVAVRPQDC
ncbi:Rid family hydrolase [uncultured Microbulbifer sp.]|uniref:Rid family hydrolase n=1 Tax=uncultured Microbulbifer sp. TaxID=348147 RepID=UPI00262FD79F|nr:Rid family hydrolase [uncultured Microbulbifer sp.]